MGLLRELQVLLEHRQGLLGEAGQMWFQRRRHDRTPCCLPAPEHLPLVLVFVDGFVYTTTANGCGAAPNAVWAIDTTADDKKVTRWNTAGRNIVGTTGPTLGTDGTLFVALAPASAGAPAAAEGTLDVPPNAVVALSRDTLTVKDWFAPPDGTFNAPPVVFTHGDRDVLAITSTDGRLFLLDGRSLGGSNHQRPLHVTAAAGPRARLPAWPPGRTARPAGF